MQYRDRKFSSKDALLIEEIDSKLFQSTRTYVAFKIASTDEKILIIKPSKYSQYCSDMQKNMNPQDPYTQKKIWKQLLTNETLLTIIEKFKDVTSTLKAQQDNRTHLIDNAIENCSRGFSINKNCNECLNNPFNQQRLKLGKEAC